MSLKSPEEIAILREGGHRLAAILHNVAKLAAPGVSAGALEEAARRLIAQGGDEPSFLDYAPKGAQRPFPAALCVSVNDEVVHGIPNEGRKVLREGDIVSLDLGLWHRGLCTDMAITLPVGRVDGAAKKLLKVTREALEKAIAAASAGKTTGDVGHAIESFIKPYGFGIVRELSGHGVGYAVHEEPFVPNYGRPGEGGTLEEGLVIAIEPMINEGKAGIRLNSDGFTYRTRDGSRSAHFEHTIVVTKKGAEILTAL